MDFDFPKASEKAEEQRWLLQAATPELATTEEAQSIAEMFHLIVMNLVAMIFSFVESWSKTVFFFKNISISWFSWVLLLCKDTLCLLTKAQLAHINRPNSTPLRSWWAPTPFAFCFFAAYPAVARARWPGASQPAAWSYQVLHGGLLDRFFSELRFYLEYIHGVSWRFLDIVLDD